MFLFLLLLFYVIGCSSANPTTLNETSIYDPLTFNFSSMTYTNTSYSDVLFGIGNPMDDFSILYKVSQGTEMPQEDYVVVEEILPVLADIKKESNYSFTYLMTMSSEDLNSLALENTIILTLTEIVAFNEMKTILEDLKSSLVTEDYSISKITYLELRVDRELTNEEVEALILIQKYFPKTAIATTTTTTSESVFYYNAYSGVSSELMDITPAPPTEEELVKMEIAYNLLESLIDN